MPNFKLPITDRRINIAIVGCGRISRNHIKAIAQHSDQAKLTAICDQQVKRLTDAKQLINEEQAKHPGSATNPASFSSYNELLSAAQEGTIPIDLVVLATPSGMHSAQVIKAAKIGMHVCTEKPMATSWADGIAMVKACDDAGVRLFVVKQIRFNPTLQLLKRQLQTGRFGRLAMVTVNVFWQRPQQYYDQDSWRGTRQLDGGALMNQASHYVDLLNWLVGPVKSVSASTATLSRKIEVEESAVLQLRWHNGALGTMAVTMITYPKNLEGSITLLGEKGTVKIGGPTVNKIEHWTFADESPDDALIEKANTQTSQIYGFGHTPYYSNVLDCLQGKVKAMCDGLEGLKSLELLIAAYQSADSGNTVHLPIKY